MRLRCGLDLRKTILGRALTCAQGLATVFVLSSEVFCVSENTISMCTGATGDSECVLKERFVGDELNDDGVVCRRLTRLPYNDCRLGVS